MRRRDERAFRVLQESQSSAGSVWSKYEGKERSETDGSWASKRELLEVLGDRGGESADTSGLVEGGRNLPKSISALKQTQREEMMAE
jgi:hypothetical protein